MNARSPTIRALLWMSLSNEPFVVLYAIVPFLLKKDLAASLTQLAILASLRPVLSIFSFYWSANLTRQAGKLRSNLIGAWTLARLPFLLVPWIESAWYLIFCCGVYELLNRSGNPALMEILKINLQKDPREKVYSTCFVISFLESILLGFIVTCTLSRDVLPWPMLFAITALISLSSVFFQWRIPLPTPRQEIVETKRTLPAKLLDPWKEAWRLLRANPRFFRIQCGFMFGGVGLMLAAPSLALFYVDTLELSHANITMGRSVLMGLGVAISSYFWKKKLASSQIDEMLQSVLFGFAMYLVCLTMARVDLSFFYVASILYGLSQAGSHLLWNLSGPIFAGTEESSQYSRVNILTVGLRGAVTPAVGGLLCHWMGPTAVLLLSGAICLGGVGYMAVTRRRDLSSETNIAASGES